MNLLQAPFRRALRVCAVPTLAEDVRLVLLQLGIDLGEQIEKVHTAPLGDPISVRIGHQLFTLRKEICRQIEVELA